MRLTTTKRWMIQGSLVIAALSGALFAACTGKGPPRPTCEDVSDAGVSDARPINPYTMLTTDAQPTTTYGMASDPGPQCVNCRQSEKYDIMAVSDFEDGFAPAWFNYGEPGILIEPPQAGEGIDDGGMPTGTNPPQPWWGLQVADLSTRPGGTRCGSKYALHMEGGRFVVWGGGYVTRHFITRGKYMQYVSPHEQHFCEVPRPSGDLCSELHPENCLKYGTGAPPAFMPDSTSDETIATGCMFWASPVTQQPSLLGVDLSEFEGISFWARRGPSGQATLRVALVDNSMSEDLALFRERRYWQSETAAGNPNPDPDKAGARCVRIKACCRHCYEGLMHEQFFAAVGVSGSPGYVPPRVETVTDDRCYIDGERLPHFGNADGTIVAWDFRDEVCGDEPLYPPDMVPEIEDGGVPPGVHPDGTSCWTAMAKEVWDSWNTDHGLCCPPTMENENPSELNGDPRYGGKPCAPYIFNFDQSSGNYCHDPGEVLPERNQNRCGEGFEAAVVVDTEWKLFTIPWAELRRFTPDKPPLDPNGVWQIAFYFGQGYLDTYLDDLGFYKVRPNARP
jgi:hypothetical protein